MTALPFVALKSSTGTREREKAKTTSAGKVCSLSWSWELTKTNKERNHEKSILNRFQTLRPVSQAFAGCSGVLAVWT